MNKAEIEAKAIDLQKALWQFKSVYCPEAQSNPLLCLNPEFAARHLGYDYACVSEFGDPRFTKGRVLGQLDMQRKSITVAGDISPREQLFTACHEIGHILLHGNDKDMFMHRERPQLGSHEKRPQKEWEADYFAACFLMSEKLVRKAFAERFGKDLPLRIDENLAWKLSPQNPDQLLQCSKDSIDREFALAQCRGTDTNYFKSLADLFNVSHQAMALRIKELKLVRWP